MPKDKHNFGRSEISVRWELAKDFDLWLEAAFQIALSQLPFCETHYFEYLTWYLFHPIHKLISYLMKEKVNYWNDAKFWKKSKNVKEEIYIEIISLFGQM